MRINDIISFLNRVLQEIPVRTGSNPAGLYADYMIDGKIYDCKIKLFGELELQKTDSNEEITIVESDIIIGNKSFFKVLIDSDIHYIRTYEASGFDAKKTMYYDFSRKDFIQVDDIIHGDCF